MVGIGTLVAGINTRMLSLLDMEEAIGGVEFTAGISGDRHQLVMPQCPHCCSGSVAGGLSAAYINPPSAKRAWVSAAA